MASLGFLGVLAILAVLPFYGSGETCLSPKPTHEVYTTSQTTMSTETVVIVEFSVDCKNKLKNLNLYVEFAGKALPATRVIGEDFKYQVSYSDEHKSVPAGTYPMRVFDEEGYADLRKAQRSGENTDNVKSLFTINVEHKGASHGQYVQSEVVATGVALLVWYLAYSARSNLQA